MGSEVGEEEGRMGAEVDEVGEGSVSERSAVGRELV